MSQLLRVEYKFWECEDGYSDERRVGDNKDDVDDETDNHQEGGKWFEFVVGSQEILDHFKESFIRCILLST